MSEYQEATSLARLIGGNGEGGLLTEAIRAKPYALLLLDELEKAHPDILNVFLQIMDDGRITDGMGRVIDCTNLLLIATSNAGTAFIQDALGRGQGMPDIKTALLERELHGVYRPEFLNRFDDIIVFTPLSPDDVVAIAYLMLEKVKTSIAEKGMTLVVTDAAVHELARLGFDPQFGARPLRRVIQERVENSLADVLLHGEAARRDTILFDVGSTITLQKAQAL